jgi:hypothetical protein
LLLASTSKVKLEADAEFVLAQPLPLLSGRCSKALRI